MLSSAAKCTSKSLLNLSKMSFAGLNEPVKFDKDASLSYETRVLEKPDSRQRHYLQRASADISPWHDLHLRPDSKELDIFNSVIEIQRQTTEKFEVETTVKFNPIVQDLKKDKQTGEKVLRHYAIPPPFNYGMIPRTWENN